MIFQLQATACFFFAVIAGTLANAPITAAGAFIGAGLFGIASAIETSRPKTRENTGIACGSTETSENPH